MVKSNKHRIVFIYTQTEPVQRNLIISLCFVKYVTQQNQFSKKQLRLLYMVLSDLSINSRKNIVQSSMIGNTFLKRIRN